jgi:hypothetical protein
VIEWQHTVRAGLSDLSQPVLPGIPRDSNIHAQ